MCLFKAQSEAQFFGKQGVFANSQDAVSVNYVIVKHRSGMHYQFESTKWEA